MREAWRLVPTNSTRPPAAATSRTAFIARCSIGTVCCRSMMWTLLRAPKMKGSIFGFQRRVLCPKWTPASSSWRMVKLGIAMAFSFTGWAAADVYPDAGACYALPSGHRIDKAGIPGCRKSA